MRVAALRDLLATLPDDDVVLVEGCNIEIVYRRQAASIVERERAWLFCDDCGFGHEHRHATGGRHSAPAGIDLLNRSHFRGDRYYPEEPVTFGGRWSRASRVAIDAHSEDPDARPTARGQG